jgi:hypothetical protein
MVFLASPLSSSMAWTLTSLAHGLILIAALIVRVSQRRRSEFVDTRSLLIAAVCLSVLVGFQLANREPWVTVSGLAFYCDFGFRFFFALLL